MRKRSETCFLVALALISSALGFSFAGAQQKVARDETPGTRQVHPEFSSPARDRATVSHRSGRVAASEGQRDCHQSRDERALQRTSAAGPAWLHCNTICDWSRESKAATRPPQRRCSGRRAKRWLPYSLAGDRTGKATWINRHVEDLNKPYGLAWQNDHVQTER